MTRSLRWQVLGPPVFLSILGASMTTIELRDRVRTVARFAAVNAMRGSFDRTLARLSDRHHGSMRRARDALHNARADTRLSALAWTAEHYQSDIERYVDEASKALHAVQVPGAAARLDLDLRRLDRQLERVLAKSQEVSAALTALVDAVSMEPSVASAPNDRPRGGNAGGTRRWPSERDAGDDRGGPAQTDDVAGDETPSGAQDYERDGVSPGESRNGAETGGVQRGQGTKAGPAGTHTESSQPSNGRRAPLQEVADAARKLGREDRGMYTHLRVVEDMARRTARWQARHASAPIRTLPVWLWGVYAFAVPVGLWLSQRCAGRLRRIAEGEVDVRGMTREESVLARRNTDNAERVRDLERGHSERAIEAERADTRARRAARDLALFQLYNDNLQNSLRSAVVVTDAAGVIASINRAAREMMRLKDDAVGTHVTAMSLHETLLGRQPDLREELAEAVSEKRTLRYEGIRLESDKGAVLVDLVVAPYQDESGASRGLLWVADDVTEQLQTKSQLLAAERLAAIGRLSAQVAHEIRNPLSAIALNAELLEEEIETLVAQERRREPMGLLRAMSEEIERLTEVTEGYLQLARLPRPSPRRVDINQIVGELLSMVGEELRVHRIEPKLELATPAPTAWADPGQIRQALLNIIRNSREAMIDGGELYISTRIDAGEAIIEVRDSGPGLAQGVQARVFEPFFSTKEEGTGLGLSLTAQILSEHGGTVTLGPAEPHGACAIMRIPQNLAH